MLSSWKKAHASVLSCLAACWFAGVAAAGSIPPGSYQFQFPFGHIEMQGVLEWDGDTWTVDRAFLVSGNITVPMELVDADGFMEMTPAAALLGGWARLRIIPAPSEQAVLVMLGDSVPFPGQPRAPFEPFFTVFNQSPDGFEVNAEATYSITKIDAGIAEVQQHDSVASEWEPTAIACTGPSPEPDDVRFSLRLSEDAILVIIIHPDGSLEMYIYFRDPDGCWAIGDLPVEWEDPFLPVVMVYGRPITVPPGDLGDPDEVDEDEESEIP